MHDVLILTNLMFTFVIQLFIIIAVLVYVTLPECEKTNSVSVKHFVQYFSIQGKTINKEEGCRQFLDILFSLLLVIYIFIENMYNGCSRGSTWVPKVMSDFKAYSPVACPS